MVLVDYNKIAEGFSNSRKKMKWEEIDHFISQYLNDISGKNILDIGCGSGRLLEQFSNYFDLGKIDYTGLDLSSEMLNNAKKNYPDKEFLNLNMLDLKKLDGKRFDFIFFIASFHHLDNLENRLKVLKLSKDLLKENGMIFMTNWALDSELNFNKYKKDIIQDSVDQFGSTDYNIYFGDYARYYHCFSLKELEYIFNENDYKILENKLFNTKKNYISIIKKVGD